MKKQLTSVILNHFYSLMFNPLLVFFPRNPQQHSHSHTHTHREVNIQMSLNVRWRETGKWQSTYTHTHKTLIDLFPQIIFWLQKNNAIMYCEYTTAVDWLFEFLFFPHRICHLDVAIFFFHATFQTHVTYFAQFPNKLLWWTLHHRRVYATYI